MKLILCTLAVCLSVLASVVTTRELIRGEGKRTRSAITKTLTEPIGQEAGKQSVLATLDAINSHLASLNRRIALLEDTSERRAGNRPGGPSHDPEMTEMKMLSASIRGTAASLDRLNGVPGHLAELTTYLSQSFDSLEKKVADAAAPEGLLTPVNRMAKKIDDIDHYFTPLYAFLGLVYDPANEDLLSKHPSVDTRLNELRSEIDAVRKAVADIRNNMMVPTVIEPTKHPR